MESGFLCKLNSESSEKVSAQFPVLTIFLLEKHQRSPGYKDISLDFNPTCGLVLGEMLKLCMSSWNISPHLCLWAEQM